LIYSVDKIENDIVTLAGDDGTLVYISVSDLSFNVKERDILIYEESDKSYRIDNKKKEERESINKKRLNNLFKRG
jgi:hypothetical protein